MKSRTLFVCLVTMVLLVNTTSSTSAEQVAPTERQVRAAVERALPLLERAAAGTAAQRTCFTCHGQAQPVIALTESQRRGFHVDAGNLKRQLDHTHAHLRRGRKSYLEGKGQGGGVDTAGYALWALEDGGREADEVVELVTDWILKKQHPDGFWKTSSQRPPSEASHFTTTYLAIGALAHFGTDEQTTAIAKANHQTFAWLRDAKPKDTEDQVFRLLTLPYSDLADDVTTASAVQLQQQQNDDGGWSQTPSMNSDAYATGTVLYALQQTGTVPTDDPTMQRGLAYLLNTQQEDGSWYVKSRSKPFQKYFESGFPHGTDQFISTSATAWATIALLMSLPEQAPPEIAALPGTKPLDWPEADLSQRLMLDAHTYVETQLQAANDQRKPVRGDDPAAQTSRQRLQTILGIVEDRLPPAMEYFGDEQNPATIAETDEYEILQVRWPVFAGVMGAGLLIKQRGRPLGQVVIIPDADQTPEQMIGFAHSPPGLCRLADHGFDVVIPAIVSRNQLATSDRRRQRAEYTEREWIYRQAFQMGRHVIGYEVQRVLAAIDWMDTRLEALPIGVAGYGEGGLIALHAAAVDVRVDAALVSGYFDHSEAVWSEPIYRNVWSRLGEFGNAEVAALITPRKLVIEHSPFPHVADHKGQLTTPSYKQLKSEFARIPGREESCRLITGADESTVGPWSVDAVDPFIGALSAAARPRSGADERLTDARIARDDFIRARQQRTTDQLEQHVQSLVRASEHVRDEFFLYQIMPEFKDSRWSTEREHPTVDPQKFIDAAQSYRERFRTQAMGSFNEPILPANSRTRKIAETDQWTAYDVVLDVHQGLFAWGVLLLPKDLQPDEQRPVVVCQHGRNGVPRDTIDADKTAYNNFAAQLAERGFITFSPHNLYRGEDQYRWLDRKANAIGCTLFSLIIAQHDATLRWLDSLPFVDGNRIAFYGLSYGGETAVRVPTILNKYCLSICSGDFNQWTRKVAATDQPFSFMNSIEWEMPYWNLGHTFDYAEMTYLMFPRPFMVERGHHDRVGRDRWIAHEFAKVRWLYAQFGMADRVDIEFFQGGHSINGQKTFDFLHKHLAWPPESEGNHQ